MKSFWKVGKWMAVLLSATVILFAGCLGPSRSSDDNAIPAKGGEVGAKYVYKFSVTPEQGKLDIEPVVMGTGIVSGLFGHTVDVTSPPCAWDGGNNRLTCTVQVKNKSKNYYMANMRTWSYQNSNPLGATLSTPDFPNTADGTTTTWTQPGAVPLNDAGKAGYCYVEDGKWKKSSGKNFWPKGCQTHGYKTVLDTWATNQMIHPDCGTQTVTWIFTTQAAPYTFYTALVNIGTTGSPPGDHSAQGDPGWYPENALNDSRMDLTHKSLFVVKPYKLDMVCPAGWSCTTGGGEGKWGCYSTSNAVLEGWKIGSAYCSTPLDTSVGLAAGRYFAVDVGIEYADRLESQNHTGLQNDTGPSTCFEWDYSLQALYTWDPTILRTATAISGYTGNTSSTYMEITTNHKYSLFSGENGGGEDDENSYRDTDAGLRDYVSDVGSNFWYLKRSLTLGAKMTFISSTKTALLCTVASSTKYTPVLQMPNDGIGWYGFAKMNSNCTTYTNDGIDADVDLWLGMHYMRVYPTAPSGSGSVIKLESDSDFSGLVLYSSNCTRAGGSNSVDGDILSTWCYPCVNVGVGTGTCTADGDGSGSGNFLQATSCASTLSDGLSDTKFYVFGSQETTNNKLAGGPNGNAGWGYQAQNSHICVE